MNEMIEAWINFAVVIFVQLLLFIVHACYEKRLHEVPKILGRSIFIGIFFGVLFDLVVGKFIGVYTYVLGFGPFFLVINGALSYGLMQANTLLMQKARLSHFYIWTVIVGVVYEVTNYYFRVWTWEFSSTNVELLIVHSFGYVGLAFIMATVWHIWGHRFIFIEKALAK
jgi:Na+/citrate or Na+/malate symporter